MTGLWLTLAAATAGGAGTAAIAEWTRLGVWRRPDLRTVAGLMVAALAATAWAARLVEGDALWVSIGLALCLIALADIDRRIMKLPNLLTFPLIGAGFAVTWWLAPERLIDHAIGAVAGYAVLAITAWLYVRLRGRDGIGLGDAKLLAAAGAWLGWTALAGVVLIGAATALAAALALHFAGRPVGPGEPIPFGPFLALGLWLSWLYGPVTFAW
jgi:leader peptidase (prepilin peptidase)/N-methyltransferase